jgi:hypothetical protein
MALLRCVCRWFRSAMAWLAAVDAGVDRAMRRMARLDD